MKLLKLAFALVLALLPLMPLRVLAADYYVDITNNTGYAIFYIYVSPEKSNSWESAHLCRLADRSSCPGQSIVKGLG
ncbi:MAG: hypothetical protein RLZZ227_1456 [Pseudomonadota bacterium]|jgi:hypothetical protein